MQKAKFFVAFLAAIVAVAMSPNPTRAAENQTVTGYVLDSACAFTKNLTKPISAQCAVACAKAGSPLVILAEDGTIYWPISDALPARGQNARLLPYAAKYVTVTGKVFARGGSRAIVITKIESAPAGR